MNLYQYAFRDKFLEKSALCEKKKKNRIKSSKEFIIWAEDKLNELHEWLKKYNFEDEETEIEFFKEIKPCLFSKLIFQKEVLRIETRAPCGTKLSLRFFEEELKQTAKNLKIDPEFYNYVRSHSNARDHVYFTRKIKKDILEIDCFHLCFDPKISTYYDHKMAIILAHDLLVNYIENRIRKIKMKCKRKKKNYSESVGIQSKLHWTRNKTELIELVYAMHFSKVINNGNSDLKEIAKAVGLLFNIEITDNLYRTFTDIKNRKNQGSKFIQSLADNFQKKITEENSL
ncbi:RteC domain-containing protein [Flavobacterium seoulense]|uniref:RteC protein n=1 Tax=Flavobacterium seoulense TaxID=1492738 RepID=A0A066WRI6_9FLAO|nr:RteC domain-containing protein [Flavobacterium seoulense]KDN56682.1 hypothetical protein FEM21_01850 [Flavobacterium seoulense]